MKKNIVVSLISKETIKPSFLKSSKPFKLSFIDQVIPTTYVPLIFFYPQNIHQNPQIFSTNLKLSLSQTLSTFFPFSGRLKDNVFVHDFEQGVPYSETKVSSDLSEFLQKPQLEILNKFLPTQPLTQITPPDETLPVLYVQFNVFQCTGIAISICISHKIGDVNSITNFLKQWADNNKNLKHVSEIITPNFEESSLRFPPFQSDPTNQISTMEKLFFNEQKRTSRRFVFDAKAIVSLKEKLSKPEKKIGNEERMTCPSTRVKTLSSFIWKCCTLASASISDTPRLSLSLNVVNIQRRTEPCFPEYSLGNLLWFSVAAYDIVFNDDDHHTRLMSDDDLKHFVELTNESVEEVLNVEFLKTLEGENGVRVASEFLEQFNEIYSTNPEIIVFSSWLNFGINDVDFGLGKPLWVSLMGEVGPALRNFTIFKEFNDGIEAWITLDDDLMEILEHDHEFLTFATPNPPIFQENFYTVLPK